MITATFSELMEHALLSTNTFIVIVDGTVIPGNITALDNPATNTTTVTFTPTSGSLDSGKTYAITITTAVEDLAMNKMFSNQAWAFTVGTLPDTTPPAFTGIVSATGTSTSTISLSWSAATDVGNVTPQNQIRYEICQSEILVPPGTNAGECQAATFPAAGGTVTRLETTGGQTTLGVTGLKKNTTYDFVVRAKDLSNNISGNIEQRSATTFGDPIPASGGTLNIDLGRTASNPSITLVGTTPYLAWEESSNNIYFKTFDGTNWNGSSTPINAAGKTGQQPRLASDGATTPTAYLTFTECDLLGDFCKVVVKKDVGGWQTVGTALNLNIDQSKSATDSAIAFDSNNTPYVVWTEFETVNTVEVRHIFVKHFDAATSLWVQDGATSLNVNPNQDGFNPSIAINGTSINVSWTECLFPTNCQIYVKKWLGSATPPSTSVNLTGGTTGTDPDDPSLSFNGGTLYAAWHETGQLHVRREETDGSFTDIENMGFVVNGSNNTLLFNDGAVRTATITPSSYTTGDALAAGLKSALESANADTDTYTVSFNTTTKQFMITNDATNANPLTLLFGNVGTTAEEIIGFDSVDTAVIAVGGSITSDFDAQTLTVPLPSNTPLAGTSSAQGPYLAFAKVPNFPTSNRPELFVRLWDNTSSTWTSVVDGKLNMTTADPSPPINASIAVSSSGSVFVAWVEAGLCLDPSIPNNCGITGSPIPQLYVKQLK